MVRRTQDGGVPSTLDAAAWRQKRSPDDEPSRYTGRVVSFTLSSNNKVSVPICKTITSLFFMRTIEYLKLETSELYNMSGTHELNLYRTLQYLSLHHLYVSYLDICIFTNLSI